MFLFAGVGSLEVSASGVGLGLVTGGGRGELILLDGFVPLVEEIQHLAGVESGAMADPVAACRLGGGKDVVLGGFGDLVLAALGVGEAEVGHAGGEAR